MATNSTMLADLILQCGPLYTLPRVAMQVLELTANPDVDTRALHACIEQDPALTAKLLKVVNSSLFGLSRQVDDLTQALALLGVKPLKLLVLGFSLPDALFAEMAGDVLGVYWRHTLTKAITARELSQQWWKLDGDEAFLAGMLQDLGLLILIQQLGEPMVGFLNRVERDQADLLDAERRRFGFDHTELTARLLSFWNLPPRLVATIPSAEFNEIRSLAATKLQRILYLAELITQMLVHRPVGIAAQIRLTMKALNLGETDRLTSLIENLEPKIDQLADVLSLSMAGQSDLNQILALAQRQMSEISVDAAAELNDRALKSQREQLEDRDEVRTLDKAVRNLAQRVRKNPATPNTNLAEQIEPEAGRSAKFAPTEFSESPVLRRDSGSATTRPVRQAPLVGKPQPAPIADDDPSFLGSLAVAAAHCRQVRTPLCLMLAEINGLANLAFGIGANEVADCLAYFQQQCALLGPAGANCLQTREGHFAVMLPDCERQQAVDLGKALISAMQHKAEGEPHHAWPVSLAVGIACADVPPRNFRERELVAAADRCLYAARSAGGGIVKSIDMY